VAEYLLEMRNVNKTFPGVKALKNANLVLRPGEVHALMGANGAGKSTLMRCLFGIYTVDSGEITLAGKKVSFSGPKDALDHGISMVHQELDQVLEQSVMENIWMARYPRKGFFVNEKAMYAKTREALDFVNVKADPGEKIGHLSVSVRQLIEIAKALSYNARVLVLDEPTSSLTESEVDLLFQAIRKIKAEGCGIIYISHKLEEIFNICDTITVMRDGEWIITKPSAEVTSEDLIKYMVNRDLTHRFPQKDNYAKNNVVLDVQSLSSYYSPRLEDVSFQLREGEILGVSGLIGARRTELVETLYGYRRRGGGRVFYKGKEMNVSHTYQAIEKGFALVTEERRSTGIFPLLSVQENIVISSIKRYSNRFGFLINSRLRSAAAQMIDSIKIKTHSQKTLIRDLSGGNQQKVILGRWLLTTPDILLMDDPTRGIDVGAKYEIYQLIINLAKEGKSIILVSSEMSELLGVTDRIMVMSNGRLAGIVNTAETNQEELLVLAGKYL
jgi:methyl-galactoside transport system ATP-binding protein